MYTCCVAGTLFPAHFGVDTTVLKSEHGVDAPSERSGLFRDTSYQESTYQHGGIQEIYLNLLT